MTRWGNVERVGDRLAHGDQAAGVARRASHFSEAEVLPHVGLVLNIEGTILLLLAAQPQNVAASSTHVFRLIRARTPEREAKESRQTMQRIREVVGLGKLQFSFNILIL